MVAQQLITCQLLNTREDNSSAILYKSRINFAHSKKYITTRLTAKAVSLNAYCLLYAAVSSSFSGIGYICKTARDELPPMSENTPPYIVRRYVWDLPQRPQSLHP